MIILVLGVKCLVPCIKGFRVWPCILRLDFVKYDFGSFQTLQPITGYQY